MEHWPLPNTSLDSDQDDSQQQTQKQRYSYNLGKSITRRDLSVSHIRPSASSLAAHQPERAQHGDRNDELSALKSPVTRVLDGVGCQRSLEGDKADCPTLPPVSSLNAKELNTLVTDTSNCSFPHYQSSTPDSTSQFESPAEAEETIQSTLQHLSAIATQNTAYLQVAARDRPFILERQHMSSPYLQERAIEKPIRSSAGNQFSRPGYYKVSDLDNPGCFKLIPRPPIPQFEPPVHPRIVAKMAAEKARHEAATAELARHVLIEYRHRPDPGHSAPTVAKSTITASVAGEDISKPKSKPRNPIFRRAPLAALTPRPSRIPTPEGIDGKVSPRNSTATTVSSRKENMPLKTHSLLRQISPSGHQSFIPRVRTMGMLSSLAGTFSRSKHSLQTSKSVGNLTSPATVSLPATSFPTVPTFTTNVLYIAEARASSYWCGRYQTLIGQQQDEIVEAATNDHDVLRRYVVHPRPQSPVLQSYVSKIPFRRFERWVAKEKVWRDNSLAAIAKLMDEEEEERQLKALRHLQALCITEEAKESLWEWQLAYARFDAKNEKFLPKGGLMTDDVTWATRVRSSDILDNNPASSTEQSRFLGLSKKSSKASVATLTNKTSVVSMRQQAQRYQPVISSTSARPLQKATNLPTANRIARAKHIPLKVDYPMTMNEALKRASGSWINQQGVLYNTYRQMYPSLPR